MKIDAYVMIKLKAAGEMGANKTLKMLASFAEVKMAHMVTGRYDIILFVTCADLKQVGELVAERIHETENIQSTVTCIAVAAS